MRRKIRKRIKKITIIAVFLQTISIISVTYGWFDNFFFGIFMCIIILIINSMGFLIYYEIINPIVKIKNDPGIVVWWWCCTRFGQSGKYKKKKNSLESRAGSATDRKDS